MRQLVPSHLSASVNGAESVRCSPTAVQAWPLHATPLKKFSVPESFGVGWMRHAVPSHRSSTVPASEPPTAVHAEDDVQDTAERPAPAAGLGGALDTPAGTVPPLRQRSYWIARGVCPGTHGGADGRRCARHAAEEAARRGGCGDGLDPPLRAV